MVYLVLLMMLQEAREHLQTGESEEMMLKTMQGSDIAARAKVRAPHENPPTETEKLNQIGTVKGTELMIQKVTEGEIGSETAVKRVEAEKETIMTETEAVIETVIGDGG